MAFQFEEQLCLSVPKIVALENEKILTKKIKLALCEIYGALTLVGVESKKKRTALDQIRDTDLAIGEFLKDFFDTAHLSEGRGEKY